ncbi:substrate-binding periplasmic protein [Thalassotalea sp. PLHSN55]|uniref:substrate-binding periplasmic protein n=1 Tax=Thalassotalea sp. PLHSN55 TaxID=3435888 RepID=UPI003F84B5E1
MKFLFCLLLFSSAVSAQQYHFAAINELIEQEVGKLVLTEIYQNIGIDISISSLPGRRAQHEVSQGNFDGEIMRIYSYGQETPTVIRVPTPYYHLETRAFTHQKNQIAIRRAKDLAPYSVAIVRGVKHTNNITQNHKDTHKVETTKALMQLIAMERADIALTNTLDGNVVLKALRLNEVKALHPPLAKLSLYHYVHEEHQALVPIIDKEIKRLKSTGMLAKMIKDAEDKVIEARLQPLNSTD